MTTKKPTIVFCHGIWADGSCFNKVIPALQADGHEVIAVQYSLESYQEDLEIVKRTLNRVGSPVLLVGHSYGGATITGAGMATLASGLVVLFRDVCLVFLVNRAAPLPRGVRWGEVVVGDDLAGIGGTDLFGPEFPGPRVNDLAGVEAQHARAGLFAQLLERRLHLPLDFLIDDLPE